MKVQAIIPTAGLGTRLNAGSPKPLLDLNHKPLFIYTLEAFEKSCLIESVVFVVHQDYLARYEKIIAKYPLKKIKKVVTGGPTRCESVANGLSYLDLDTKMVVIHDGARPLIKTSIVDQAVSLCEDHAGVVVAVAVKPTIKKVDPDQLVIRETLQRDDLWEIQTPQVFKKEILLKAYKDRRGNHFTDDAALVEAQGHVIKILQGDYQNIKVTTREDILIAETILAAREH